MRFIIDYVIRGMRGQAGKRRSWAAPPHITTTWGCAAVRWTTGERVQERRGD